MRHVSTIGLLAVLAIPSCKAFVTADLFTADLTQVALSLSSATASAVVAVEAISKETCNEESSALATALMAGFGSAEFIGCGGSDLETFSEFRVQLPIISADQKPDAAIAFVSSISDRFVQVNVVRSEAYMAAISAALPEDMKLGGFDQIEMIIRARVNNDLGKAISLEVKDAFVDGKPRQALFTANMNHRDQLAIRISDVGNASVSSEAMGASMFRFAVE
ncbi:MAG: hypothetical protein V4747_11365 [Pseudomonadota bacterium]